MKEQKLKVIAGYKIPEDWEVVRLNEICKKIKAGGTPLTTEPQYWNGNIPFVKIEDVTTSGKYLTRTTSYISELGLRNSNSWLVQENALLLTMYGSLGEVTINKIPVTTNQAILAIIPKDKEDLEFLYYWFLFFKPFWKKYAKPTTQANLTAEIVKNIDILYPKKKEERKAIAQILSTVDEAIQKVDEIIAKTERLKKGLMQRLLTKGIGHKEFKDTEIGRIPKEWEVVRLEDVVEVNKETCEPTKEFPNKEFLYVDIESVENGTGVISDVKRIQGKEAPSRARRVIHHNDVIMSTVRPYLKAFAIIPKELDKQICSTGFAVLSCGKKILPSYLLYVLFSNIVINQCNRMMIGGQYPALNESQVTKIKVPLPPLPEQQKIAEILSTVDKKLELERKRKEKLERIKKGLMNDLLTGKKRVKLK